MSAPDRVVLLDAWGDVQDVVAVLRASGLDTTVTAADRVPAGDDVVAVMLGAEVAMTADQLRGLPRLRVVAATSAGYDHVPVAAAADQGVWVTSTQGATTEEVAEHTLALVLGLLRSTHRLDAHVHAGGWDLLAAPPRRVAGTALGLVGAGRISRAVAVRASALGMRVLVHGRAGSPHGVGFQARDELADLLAEADVLSLHVPLTPETAGMVDAALLARLRPGSFLVNVSRGGLVDSAALASALASGHLAGAALDVLPVEPPPPDEPLLTAPNTVLTPHAAWYSPDALRRPFRVAAAQVAAVLLGAEPEGAVVRPA